MTVGSEWRASAVVLAGVLTIGVALAVSLPRKQNQPIVLEISCVSGAPVVGVWVQAENGGSGFADPTGVLPDGRETFAFELSFAGAYELHTGCGGNREHWNKVTHSTMDDIPARRLRCDDTVAIATTANPGRCRDLP